MNNPSTKTFVVAPSNLNNCSIILTSAERMEALEYMRFAHESIIAVIEDSRVKRSASPLLIATMVEYAERANVLRKRLST